MTSCGRGGTLAAEPDEGDIRLRRGVIPVKRMLLVITAAAMAAGGIGILTAAGTTSTVTTAADLTIRHATAGCHDWSLAGGSFKTSQTVFLREGQSFAVTNRDNCGHALVQVGGPTAALAGEETIEPLGAPVRVQLTTPGLYTFTTTESDTQTLGATDASQHLFGLARLSSVGADNALMLHVRVLPLRLPTD